MRFVAGGFAAAAGLRLFAGIGVDLDDAAVGIADAAGPRGRTACRGAGILLASNQRSGSRNMLMATLALDTHRAVKALRDTGAQ